MLFGPFSTMLCLRKPDFREEAAYMIISQGSHPDGHTNREDELSRLLTVLEGMAMAHNNSSNGDVTANNTANLISSKPAMDSIRMLSSSLTTYVTRKNDTDSEDLQKAIYNREWHFLARVMDRIFLLIYVIVIAASLILLFPKGTKTAENLS